MARAFIPWHVFFQAMHNQPEAGLDVWLARWRFGDDGVFAELEQLPHPKAFLRAA